MKRKIQQLANKGFFHIFGSNIINKVVLFCNSIFLVRLLTKEEFGLFSYAENLIMLFLLFNGLGTTAATLQYGSEAQTEEKRNSYFYFGIKTGSFYSIIICLLILIISNFVPFKESRTIIRNMCLVPMFLFFFESIQVYFRISLKNKKFSILNSLNTFLLTFFSLLGAYFFNITGIVLFRYLAYIITIITGIYLFSKEFYNIFNSIKLNNFEIRNFLKFSFIAALNNAISQLLYLIDIFLIGNIILNKEIVASYKTATLIPFALNFIPLSIMMFIYPYFAKNNTNIIWIKHNYLKLTQYLFIINFFISLFLILFASQIIQILFGYDYQDAIIPFKILAFGYFIAATFRIPVGNILVMLKQIKFGLYLSLITGIFNIILDIFLIKYYGIVGAAFSTLIVFTFTSILGTLYLVKILK